MLLMIRKRRFQSLRSVALAILALGLAVQSLLGVLGEMHEVSAHAEIVLQHHDHAGQDEAAESGPLHLLLHHTHCCSHCAWMSGGDSSVALFALTPADLPFDTAGYLPAAGLATPFRPPIRA